MPGKLDKTPDERPEPGSTDLQAITRGLTSSSSQDSTVGKLDLYNLILDDVPLKMTESQAGFVRGGGDDGGACGGCAHYYLGKAAKRQVCEIVRTDDDTNIEPGDRCRFFTVDTQNYPFLNPTKNKAPEGK